MTVKLRGASSSSFSAYQWTYDVFLSYRGKDTCKNFTRHLYNALERDGHKTFIDDEQSGRGVPKNIPSAFLKVIEESRISIVAFSRNYASSIWCLDLLTKIIECMETKKQIVVPVFYGVDLYEVQHQKNEFGESFARHEQRFKDNPEKVRRWRAVLTQVSNLSGWQLKTNGNELEFIHRLLQFIDTKIQVARHPVEIKSLVQEPHLSSSPSQVGIESPVQEPYLSSSPSPVGKEYPVQEPHLSSSPSPVGIESPTQEPHLFSSKSSIGIKSSVQEPHLSSSPSQVGIESPRQKPNLSSTQSQVGIESPLQEPYLSNTQSPVGIESPVQEPLLSSSRSLVGIEFHVQEPHLSKLPSENGEQRSNSFLSSHGIILFLIASVIGLLQLDNLFKTHPANMWISEAALVIFCLSYAAMTKINGTRWARYSQIIDSFRVLSGTLVAVSLSSIHLPHQLSWLFYAIWAFLVFIIVACTWIYPEVEGREVETRISLVPV